MSEEGSTFLLTTRDLKEIEELCLRVIVRNKGEIIFDVSIVDLKIQSDFMGELKVDFPMEISQDKIKECIGKEGVTIKKLVKKRIY